MSGGSGEIEVPAAKLERTKGRGMEAEASFRCLPSEYKFQATVSETNGTELSRWLKRQRRETLRAFPPCTLSSPSTEPTPVASTVFFCFVKFLFARLRHRVCSQETMSTILILMPVEPEVQG